MKKTTPGSRRTAENSGQSCDTQPPVISLVNLGCAKNLVDSERILGQLAEDGFLIAQDPALAEICLVNTCGFIHDAREETAGVLGELSQLKEAGSLKHLVALGCLVERAADAPELGRFLKAADIKLGFKEYPRLAQICRDLAAEARNSGAPSLAPGAERSGPKVSAAKKKVPQSYNDFLVSPRLRIGAPHTAFLKISEGCSNPCRFCSIPRMRGLQVSRPIEKIVAEARELAGGGAREINLIAQDTTSYGRDLYHRPALPELLQALLKVKGPRWLRLMYAYPKFLTAEMLDVLAGDERFCPYIDIPLQHISDPMLSAMGRGVTKRQTLDLLDLIARKLPGGAIRTTFIAGYPGETEKDFEEMLALIQEGRFTHAGVFLYSSEPLTPAAKLADTVPLKVKAARREALMLAQLNVARRRQQDRAGRTVELLIDGLLPKGSNEVLKSAGALARSSLEAPEVDGVIFLEGRGAGKLAPGDFVRAQIVRALDYDTVARLQT